MKAQYLAAGTPIILNHGAMFPTRQATITRHESTSFGVNTWIEVEPLEEWPGYQTTIEGEETELGVGWRVAG